jgi:ribosomal protein S18
VPALRRLVLVASALLPVVQDAAQVSHFAFVNPGGPKVPDLAKAKRYGITRLYWEARDPQISAALFLAIRERGMEVGIMRDPSWDNSSAIDLARELDADLGRLGASNSQCAVLADIEYHDPAYITAFLDEWRALRPRRVTGWTLEPLQGGWMSPEFVYTLTWTAMAIFPQSYLGNMSPVDPDLVRCDLTERGIPKGMVGVVYNAAHIPTHWDGIAFRFDQLP